jgi:hypothetical protein
VVDGAVGLRFVVDAFVICDMFLRDVAVDSCTPLHLRFVWIKQHPPHTHTRTSNSSGGWANWPIIVMNPDQEDQGMSAISSSPPQRRASSQVTSADCQGIGVCDCMFCGCRWRCERYVCQLLRMKFTVWEVLTSTLSP